MPKEESKKRERLCEECEEPIPLGRIELIPNVRFCVECQHLVGDVFQYKMKTVGFNEEPTIAKTKEHWEVLKKQKQVRDI